MVPQLIAVEGPLTGRTVALSQETVSIGREPDCTIPLPDGATSRLHCVITVKESGVEICDHESRNGTFVNGQKVNRALLGNGDEIRIGSSRFVFRDAGDEPSTREPSDALATIVLRPGESRYLSGGTEPEVSRRAVSDLAALLGFACAIHECETEEEIQDRLVSLVLQATVADCAAVVMPEDDSVHGAAANGSSRTPAVSRTILDRVRAERAAVLSNDVPQDEYLSSSVSLAVRLVRSVLAVPLEERGEIGAVLYLESSNPEARFDENDLQLLTALGNIASLAIRNVRRLAALADENRRLRNTIGEGHGIVGESGAVKEVLRLIARVAPVDSTVLITGESGTGKELVARAIHASSGRSTKPFVAINCAAIPENLLESELFGHEKGAFTNAVAQKKGKVEVAEGGVLFLDEVGDMSPALQAKLLRVLQEREFERLGGNKTIKADVRVVAATHRDLLEMSKTGAFRLDLFYRLHVLPIHLPPLRERRGDIPLLAQHFIAVFAAKTGRRVLGLSSSAKAALVRHGWPGNIRELQNAIESAVALGMGELIEPEDLPAHVRDGDSAGTEASGSGLHEQLNEAKRQIILRTIEETGNNYTEAAHRLGIHPNHLFRLVKTLNLTPKRQKPAPPAAKTRQKPSGQ